MARGKRKTPSEFSSQPYASSSQSEGYVLSQPGSSQPKRVRTSNHSGHESSVAGSSQAVPLEIDDTDDEELEDGSQETDDGSGRRDEEYSYGLYGIWPQKIVGCQYYRGMATIGEVVIARREPHNRYDSNAIQVLNVRGEQIGHIPRGPASKLAKYMDDRSLLLETQITGSKHYDCPIEIRLYGTNEPAARENLLARMRADKLPVGNAADRKRKEALAKKVAEQAARDARKKGGAIVAMGHGQQFENPMGEFAAGSSQGMGLGPSLDDIVGASERFNPRNVAEAVETFGMKEDDLANMSKAAQPEALLTELHDFQLQGLQWMLDKESPQLPAAGTKDVVQLWQRHPTQQNAFTNLATNYSIHNPELASGGILADDMGLGKTIQVISLIVADRALGRRANDTCDATLILAPVSVMSNWSTQMKKHLKEGHGLRVMFYHGTRKQPITPKSIGGFDVVITTYDSVSSEWHSKKSPTLPRQSGLFSVKWRRIILDEGHNIRNPKAKKTVAATNLLAQSRWVLTGTPIINNLKDLYSLVRFLRLTGGLDNMDIFHGAIIRPVNQGDVRGNQSLQLLMGGICLRRKKEMAFIDLRLPELSEYVHKITFLSHEQEKYDALEAQAKGTLDALRGDNRKADTYRHLLEVLLRMRQLCNHWKLVGEERLSFVMDQLEKEGVLDLTEENKHALQQLLQLSIDSQEDCPVCMDTCNEPVITKCAHVFCTNCAEQFISRQHKCPMCRAELESLATSTVPPAKEKAAPPPPTQEQLRDAESLDSECSSKVEALLSILKASAKDPTNKTIVFSQWTSFLDLIQPHLAANNITFTRIDGSMSARHRDAALEALDSDPKTTVLLASLAVCSVGLNLVAANQVIMADSWWAPAIEDQAVDRVHRLGQKRETKVFRLVIEHSVEEKVLGIQEDKRRLMSLAFAERESRRKGRRRAGAGLADLERLLGGATTT
ncbi:hypothetical protein K504DRAFT_430964 [Pleomassaria siparia CBS 279.74]|uniref:SNF2 family helicase n=1 Tax=Pleomassaria siparia CBS 279.74 TaxID=1314801 RepID=A0A6G1KD81_9PLEO|nr:hypothetical protein K504DRAFT_430964 [Pleomassaria siparia CBS 279.74]